MQNAAAGFWGSALKKLSGVTAAAVGVQPLPARRELGGDEPTPTAVGASNAEGAEGSSSSSNEKEGGAAVAGSAAALASYEAAAHSRSTVLGSFSTSASTSTTPAAPHQPPARGSTTSSPPAASPYATIKATVSSTSTAPPAPPPLSVGELKRVRFRMASLKVVYPINGPNGPLAPWEEALTRKR